MKTIILQEPGRLLLTDTPTPQEAGPGQALVRVHRVGVCGTDIHAYRGEQPYFSYPRILGHELGVEVIAIGPDVTAIQPGDCCAVEPYLRCGSCSPCQRGRTNCCESLKCLGVQTDGGMREMIVVPADQLHRSDQLDYDALALVETLGIGKHAVDRATVRQGDRVAVLGLGPIGLTVAQFAQIAGADVIGIDMSPQRADTAMSLLGIKAMVIEPDPSIEKQWISKQGDLPLTVFDATGNRQSMQSAFSLPINGGTLVFVGLVKGDVAFDDPGFHRKELTLLSSRNSTGIDFKQIIRLIEEDRVDIGPWITHRCDAEFLPGIFDDWLQPDSGLLKGVVSL